MCAPCFGPMILEKNCLNCHLCSFSFQFCSQFGQICSTIDQNCDWLFFVLFLTLERSGEMPLE
ncbi:unnamed protein product [Ectocarpus sp. 13 AM-2016]